MKLIMENWRRYIEEMLNAPIKNRPALNIYPDPDMLLKPDGTLDMEDAATLKKLLDMDMQNIGEDPQRDAELAMYTKRMKDLLDGLRKNPPKQRRSPEEIQKFKEIDKAVKDVQAQIQLNLMKSRIGAADTVDSDTEDFGTPQKNIKTVGDFPPQP